MIDKQTAERIALEYARELGAVPELALVPDQTMEAETAWMVFVQAREFVETGDQATMIVGMGGLIVDKNSGAVTQTGSAEPPEAYLKRYRPRSE